MRNHSDQRLTKFRETISLLCQAYFFALVSIKGYRICGFLWESKASRYLQISYKSMISYYENDHGDMKQSMIAEFADILGTTVEYLICGVIKTPELDADSVEMLKLFGAMDDKTRQIMLVQMRAVAKI